LRDQTVLIINGDHGEEFGEHGGGHHARTVYEEVIRAPLIFHAPGVLEPRRIDNVVSALDIMPTLFDLLELPRPSRLRGSSLYAGLCGRSLEHDRAMGRTFDPSPFVASMNEMRIHLSYVLRGEEKIILDHLTGGIEVYDLKRDPGETKNLYTQDPPRDHVLLGLLDQWLYDMNSFGEYSKVTNTDNGPPVPVEAAPGDRFTLSLVGDAGTSFQGFYDVDRRETNGQIIEGRWTMGHGVISLHHRRFHTDQDCTLKAQVAGADYELVFNGQPLPNLGAGTHRIPLSLLAERTDHRIELVSNPTIRGEHARPFGAMLQGLGIECPSR
jgi:hypothetical protein